ncbi:MAG: endo-1,4-beta-xylanase [Fibromonadaceae bacterium]|jgi:GH35 family endo-1,4-beta-xylanase|nr:endo-1,4-beta-xylanase [Fibromonadaceae bacterium]
MKKFAIPLCFAAIFSVQVFAQEPEVGLKDVYANYFRFGTIFSENSGKVNTISNSAMQELVLKEFNSITPENELKPTNTMVKTGSTDDNIQVSLSKAAGILSFCEANNIPVRGHTLVWHRQTPSWFFRENFEESGSNYVTPEVMDKRLESYIKNMFTAIETQYPNLNLYAYDVVNEAVGDDDGKKRPECNSTSNADDDCNPNSMWTKIYGDNSFIEKAFTYARKHAPANTKLYYNDFNEYIEAKRDSIIEYILEPLKKKGVLDGMGMQSHIDVRNGGSDAWPSANQYGQAVKAYKDAGVEIQVTELDATINSGDETKFEAQAVYYRDIMKAIMNNGGDNVKAVVVWGIRDDQSWRSDRKPLLFAGSGNTITKKPAYDTLFALIDPSEWGDGKNVGVGIEEGNFVLVAKPSPPSGGIVTRDSKVPPGGYAPNSVVTLTASPKTGWGWNGWSGDIGGCDLTTEVTMDSDKNITARFVQLNDGTNLVADGSFPGTSLGSSWEEHLSWDNANATSQVSGGKYSITVNASGSKDGVPVSYQPQLVQENIHLEEGTTYKLTFTASATAPRTMEIVFQHPGTYDTYTEKTFDLTTAEKDFEYEFEMSETNDNSRIGFNFGGNFPNSGSTPTPGITLSNIKLLVAGAEFEGCDPNGQTPIIASKRPTLSNVSLQSLSGKRLLINTTSPTVVDIYDLKGKKAATFNVSGSQIVNLPLPNGVYFAKARGMQNVKFMLK